LRVRLQFLMERNYMDKIKRTGFIIACCLLNVAAWHKTLRKMTLMILCAATEDLRCGCCCRGNTYRLIFIPADPGKTK